MIVCDECSAVTFEVASSQEMVDSPRRSARTVAKAIEHGWDLGVRDVCPGCRGASPASPATNSPRMSESGEPATEKQASFLYLLLGKKDLPSGEADALRGSVPGLSKREAWELTQRLLELPDVGEYAPGRWDGTWDEEDMLYEGVCDRFDYSYSGAEWVFGGDGV